MASIVIWNCWGNLFITFKIADSGASGTAGGGGGEIYTVKKIAEMEGE